MQLKEWMYDFPTNKKKSANLLIDSFFYAWVVFCNKSDHFRIGRAQRITIQLRFCDPADIVMLKLFAVRRPSQPEETSK
ncbi:MAG: hypothetical protein ACLUN5_02350 [Oscillospiraceae bacterium]